MLVNRHETVVSKQTLGQGHFHVTKYNRAGCIALNLPYSGGLVSFVMILATERDHILIHSLLTIRRTGIMGMTPSVNNKRICS